MSSYRISNLSRDLFVSVALLVMAVVAVVPAAIAVMISLAGFVGLMLFRLRIAHVPDAALPRSPRHSRESMRTIRQQGVACCT